LSLLLNSSSRRNLPKIGLDWLLRGIVQVSSWLKWRAIKPVIQQRSHKSASPPECFPQTAKHIPARPRLGGAPAAHRARSGIIGAAQFHQIAVQPVHSMAI
jgi:hypothetical protein